ncbi:MAG: serine protease, partial [Bdellovibrionales bacterium]
MKWLFFYIINLVSVSASLASTCDVLKVTSQDPINKTQFFGNGFAYTNKLIITNDHILAPDATEVDLSGPINTKALIIHRDFHTDLALLQIRSGQLKACQLNNPSGEEITIEGFEKEDSYLSKIEGLIKNANSGKLLVPGILKSLEIVAHGQMQMRSSQSGSAVLQSGKLIGLVTQKTKEGTALVIGAQDIS